MLWWNGEGLGPSKWWRRVQVFTLEIEVNGIIV
jgi:hypothetical protein